MQIGIRSKSLNKEEGNGKKKKTVPARAIN